MLRSMSGLGVVFLAIALIVALFGLLGVSSESWAGEMMFSFLVLAVAAFVWAWLDYPRKVSRPPVTCGLRRGSCPNDPRTAGPTPGFGV